VSRLGGAVQTESGQAQRRYVKVNAKNEKLKAGLEKNCTAVNDLAWNFKFTFPKTNVYRQKFII